MSRSRRAGQVHSAESATASRSARPSLEPARQTRHRPVYARLLGLRNLAPGGFLCFMFLEGTIALGVLLALAELVSWWGVLVLPLTVAVMVKLNDVIAGAVGPPAVPSPRAVSSAAGRASSVPTTRVDTCTGEPAGALRSHGGVEGREERASMQRVDLGDAVAARQGGFATWPDVPRVNAGPALHSTAASPPPAEWPLPAEWTSQAEWPPLGGWPSQAEWLPQAELTPHAGLAPHVEFTPRAELIPHTESPPQAGWSPPAESPPGAGDDLVRRAHTVGLPRHEIHGWTSAPSATAVDTNGPSAEQLDARLQRERHSATRRYE